MRLFNKAARKLIIKCVPEIFELSDDLASVSREIGILKCEKHLWKETNNPFFYMVAEIKCENCGKIKVVSHEELASIKLNQARDRFIALGGVESTEK